MNIFKKITSFILCVAIMFTLFVSAHLVPKAQAVWGVTDVSIDVPVGAGTWMDTGISIANKVKNVLDQVLNISSDMILVAAKVAAVLGVQKAVALMIGGSGDGAERLIRDYGVYLYVSPKQQALEQMNDFFKTTSSGRFSSYNYEGVGSTNYDAYLVAQARQAISSNISKTTLQNQAVSPDDLFAEGNMKGWMAYLKPGNNVPSYVLNASAYFEDAVAKNQDIARTQQQNGFLPKIVNGRIESPALMAQNALIEVDKSGMQLIMDADTGEDGKNLTAALKQVFTGSMISISARAANYGISDKEGQQKMRNQNDDYPFSSGYGNLGKTKTK